MIGIDPVKLGGGLVVLAAPGFAAIDRNGPAAVVGIDHKVGIPGINPKAMMVAVDVLRKILKGFPSIDRFGRPRIQNINGIFVNRIGKHMGVIPGALVKPAIIVNQRPILAAVLRPVKPALFVLGLNDGVNPVRVGRNGNPGFTNQFRQTFIYCLPGIAAIG